MRTRRSASVRNFAISAAGLLLAQSAHAATVTLTASNGAGTSSFASATSWSNTAAPSAANDYFVTTARTLRTVADSGNATFAGNSLTLGDGTTAGILIFKNQATGAVVTVNNLTLNNGEIQAGGTSAGAVNTVTLAGNGITLTSGSSNRLNTGATGRGIIVSAPISGSGSLVISSAGNATLTGANAYTGSTTVSSGSFLNIGNNGTTGSLSSSSSIGNSGTILFKRTDTITQGTDFGTISGTGALQQVGTGTVVLNTANAYSGITTIGAAAAAGTLRATANGALGSGTIQLDTTGNGSTARLELAGDITLSNPTVNLPARNNTSVGIQNISGNNTLSGALNLGIGGTNYTIQSDSGLLTLSGAFTTSSGATRALTLQGAGNGLISGAIGANLTAVTKADAGTWTLSNTNSYTGPTAITGGTLLVNGSLANTAVTVSATTGTATLGGSGTLGGATTLGTGAILDAGSAASTIGALTFSSTLGLGTGSTASFQLNSSTGLSDSVSANGLTLSGTSLSLSDLGSGVWTGLSSFVLIDNTSGGSISGTFTGLIEGASISVGANVFAISYVGGTGNDITLSAVPEPSTFAALAGLAGLGLAASRRRRRA